MVHVPVHVPVRCPLIDSLVRRGYLTDEEATDPRKLAAAVAAAAEDEAA